MEFESKVFSKQVFDILYETGKTVSTAESCTSGRIAEALTSVPGASDYFVGGIVSYSDSIKVKMLNVDASVIEANTAVCEEVAIQMVKGSCETMGTDYAISATGFAGPGSENDIPVGTIWLACGSKDNVKTFKLEENDGREINLLRATNQALTLFGSFLKEQFPQPDLSEVPAIEAK